MFDRDVVRKVNLSLNIGLPWRGLLLVSCHLAPMFSNGEPFLSCSADSSMACQFLTPNFVELTLIIRTCVRLSYQVVQTGRWQKLEETLC